jgi:hypothetical protein
LDGSPAYIGHQPAEKREVSADRNTAQKHRLSNRAGRVEKSAGDPQETDQKQKQKQAETK